MLWLVSVSAQGPIVGTVYGPVVCAYGGVIDARATRFPPARPEVSSVVGISATDVLTALPWRDLAWAETSCVATAVPLLLWLAVHERSRVSSSPSAVPIEVLV